MAGPIVSTPFQRGRPVGWAELEALRNEIARLKPSSGIGYKLNQSPSGWSLSIPSSTTGGGSTTCSWKVTVVELEEIPYLEIPWGMVGVPPVLPTGMTPNNDPPMQLPFAEGWVCMKVSFIVDDVAINEVIIEIYEDIPSADEEFAYYPIAYAFFVNSEGAATEHRVNNLCSNPIPSVCDLALPA
jgi:hypothetical protein